MMRRDKQSRRRILFFTGKRGGFNHMVPLFEELRNEPGIDWNLLAADMHLSARFGSTLSEVRRHAKRVIPVKTLIEGDSPLVRARSVAKALDAFARHLDRLRPDFVFVLGDRGEVLAMAIAAMELNIPVIHLFGGDATQGGVDELTRHAVTKISSVHLASNSESARRIIRMGENPKRVFVVGAPALDLVRARRYTSDKEIRKKFGLGPGDSPILLLQHSVTWQVGAARSQAEETMAALAETSPRKIVVHPCGDPGFSAILRVYRRYQGRPDFSFHRNIAMEDFWGLMRIASVLVGNSSAGVMETPCFGLPAVDIGIRQEGRLRAGNVLHAEHDRASVRRAVKKAMQTAFRQKAMRCGSPYGDGRSARRIVRILARLGPPADYVRKKVV